MSANQRAVLGIHPFRLGIGAALVLGLCFGVTGCAEAPAGAPAAAPISVTVSYPVERDVTDYADFTARITAVQSVDIRSRVTGYLHKMAFKEGSEVKAGDLLFLVDPRPYKAQLDQAQGQVDLQKASLKVAKITLARDLAINRRVANAISQQQIDQEAATVEEEEARVRASEQAKEVSALNHEFTRVVSPIDGQISRYYLTLGNLVNADQTLLTTVVSVDPMYAYFDMDEATVQRLRRSAREGRARSAEVPAWPVSLGLATEEGFPHQGTINFADNQVNPQTGTLRVRGVFSNKDESLTAGYFARVRIPTGRPHGALLVSDRALDNDQGQKVLYVLNDRDEVVSRPVRVGALHDGLRAIEDGLRPGERVIVSGLLQVRPGVIVEPKRVPMPTSGVRDPDASASVAKATPHSRLQTPGRRPR
jgi:RND family efflux transporter MFP subunit